MRLQLVLVAVWAVTRSYRLTFSRDLANFHINAHGVAATAHQRNIALQGNPLGKKAGSQKGAPNSSAPSAFDAASRSTGMPDDIDPNIKRTLDRLPPWISKRLGHWISNRLGPWISKIVADNHRNVEDVLTQPWVDDFLHGEPTFSLAIDGAAIVYEIMDGKSKKAAKNWLKSKGLKEIYIDTDKKFMVWGDHKEKLILIACKGTVPSDNDDLMLDGHITLDTVINKVILKIFPVSSFYNMSSRHKRNDAEAWLLLEDFKKWLRENGGSSRMSGFTVIVTGHSLGAPSASTFGKFLNGVQQEHGFKVLVYGIDPAPVKTAAYDYTLRDANDPVSFEAPKGKQHLAFYDQFSDWRLQQPSPQVFLRAHGIEKLCSKEYREKFANPQPEYMK